VVAFKLLALDCFLFLRRWGVQALCKAFYPIAVTGKIWKEKNRFSVARWVLSLLMARKPQLCNVSKQNNVQLTA